MSDDRTWSALEQPEDAQPATTPTTPKGPLAELFSDRDDAALPPAFDLPPEVLAQLDELANSFLEMEKLKNHYTTELSKVTDQIKRYTEGSGSYNEKTIKTEKHTITLSHPERMTWDKDLLEKMFGEKDDLPDHITHTFGVDKRKWDKLTPEAQAELEFALTRKIAPPKIEVKPHV
jgi:hypothetical protein